MFITDKEFHQLANYIENNYGIHLKDEKKTLVVGRLQNVLQEKNLKSFSEYYDYVVNDDTKQAAITLVNKITTNHTFFMREADHFQFFQHQVLPFLKGNVKEKDLRIWSAGCSSGEEPYTLAMILDEYFSKEKMWWDTKVLATDISEQILTKAQTGQYPLSHIENLPPSWKTNYFSKANAETAKISDKIKKEVIFRKFNLMTELFPFKKRFHVIFCRNVMIYFENKTKVNLVDRFYDHTEKGGYLFIGHSESLNRETTRYKYVMPGVYRKI